MRVLWAINGWGQSAGWSLLVQTIANWNTLARRAEKGTEKRIALRATERHIGSQYLREGACFAPGGRKPIAGSR